MKLLFDENFERSVAEYFTAQGHDVVHVGVDEPGTQDKTILDRAHREKRIIITNDLDFGYLVFQTSRKHSGIVLFRLRLRTTDEKIAILDHLLEKFGKELSSSFVVISPQGIKIRKV